MNSKNHTVDHDLNVGVDLEMVVYFRKALIDWYLSYGRKLPWRETKDPYKIWISEVILQQTQVIQGLEYYNRFIERYPTVRALAESSEEDLLLMWQGLGYYSRAHNLHQAAQYIVAHYDAEFPRSRADVSKLKGIGPYTLAAVMSIAYNEPLAVVDGNVYRVLSRLLDLDVPIDTTLGQKTFRDLAQTFLEARQPALYNQGIMDLGAMVCTPKLPKCGVCPVVKICKCAYSSHALSRPIKSKRVVVREEFLDFFMLIQNGYFWIQKRGNDSIWKGLYQLPLVHSLDGRKSDIERSDSLEFSTEEGNVSHVYQTEHRLTHRLLNIKVHTIHVTKATDLSEKGFIKIPISHHSAYAFPKPLREFLDKYFS